MDELYPSMNIQYNPPFTSVAEIYVYGSAVIGIIAALTLICIKEPGRIYKINKRKNTDESPIINI